jgi:hypothetical protein
MYSPTLQFAPLNQPPTPAPQQGSTASTLQFSPLDQPPTVAAQPSDQITQPGSGRLNDIAQRGATALTDELGNIVQGVAQPVKAAVKAVVAPPVDPREHAVASRFGPDALVAYRAARGITDAAESWFKGKKETAEQAAVDMANAVNEFHHGNYRNAVADTASTIAGMGALTGNPADTMGRTREIAQGTKPGGDLVTPTVKDLVDLGATAVAEKTGQIEAGDVADAATHVYQDGKILAKNAAELPGKAVNKAVDVAGKVADKLTPEMLAKPVEPVKPVTPHVSAPTPLDDATLGAFDKNLTPEARQTIRDAAGDTVPAGSSVKNQMLKAVPKINETIAEQGLKLNKILQDAGELDTTSAQAVTNAVNKLKHELPGGTEDQFGKSIDKEMSRAHDVMQSTNPVEINNYIRELDKRINSYTAPEEPLDTAADAADAARVTIRRALRDKLNNEIPATKGPNDILGRNLEARASLRKKLGEVAHDSVAADAQHTSELTKGQDYLAYEQRLANVERNWKILGPIVKGALFAGGGGATYETIKHLFE